MRKSFAIFLSVSILLLTFIYLKTSIDPVHLPQLLLLTVTLLILSLCVGFISFHKPEQFDYSILHRRIFWVCALYLIVLVASTVSAINKSESLFEVTKAVLFILVLIFSSLLLSKSDSDIHSLARLLSISTLLLSIIGICQYHHLGFEWIPGNVVPYATMANKNLLASTLAFSLPFVLLASLESKMLWRILGNVSAVAAIYVILVSQTRAVWVALAVAILFTVCAAALVIRSHGTSSGSSLVKLKRLWITALLLLAVGLPAILGGRDYAARAASVVDPTQASAHERLILWKKSIDMFTDHPILGVGPGNWKINIPAYGTAGLRSETGDIHFQRPHNDYLWVLCESGPLALLLYSAFYGFALYYCLKGLITFQDNDSNLVLLAILFGLIIVMTEALFSFSKERVYHQTLIMLMLSVIISIYHRQAPSSKSSSRLLPRLLLLFAPPFLVFALIIGYHRLNAEIHTQRAMSARAAGQHAEVITEMTQALSCWATLDPTAAPLTWYRGVAYYSLDSMSLAFEDFQKAYEAHPNHIHVLNNLGTCFENRDDHEKASELYQRALEIAPAFDEARLNLAATYYNSGKYVQAYLVLSAIKNGLTNPRYQLFYDRITKKLTGGNPP